MISDKIKTREELATISANIRKSDKKTGFTSGAFDILHAGHVDYLEKAKKLCDILIVGINSDQSIKRYKGENRPIIPEKYRLEVVAALESVDFVFLFDERRNKINIEMFKPDYYIKASDYSSDQLTSKEIVNKYGGQVQLIPISHAISTSEIINKINSLVKHSSTQVIAEEEELLPVWLKLHPRCGVLYLPLSYRETSRAVQS